MTNLNNALQPVVSFRVVNTDSSLYKTLCLIPGHYDTATIMSYTSSGSTVNVISYLNPAVLNAAGYACNEVADDHNANLDGSSKDYPITVTPAAGNSRYRDFLHYVGLVGSRIKRIRLTNNTGNAAGRVQFDQFFEVSASAIGSKAGSDYINLASCKDPKNYDLDVIDVDLDARNLVLDATTLLFLKVAPSTDFTIEFTLDK